MRDACAVRAQSRRTTTSPPTVSTFVISSGVQPARRHQPCLLAHATGFHARCWDCVVAELPAARHVIALDQRGHGRSAKIPPFNWESFGSDLAAFVAKLNLQRLIGVGHSMGGHAVVQAAAREGSTLRTPGARRSGDHGSGALRGNERNDGSASNPVLTRQQNATNQWRSWEAMFERLRGRGSFAVWRDDALEDYCRFGLLPNPDGPDWMLACPPWVEASI